MGPQKVGHDGSDLAQHSIARCRTRAPQVALVVKNLPADAGDAVQPLGQEIPWRRAWQTTPVFLTGESHGQRSLAGYSPQGCKESDMTEAT